MSARSSVAPPMHPALVGPRRSAVARGNSPRKDVPVPFDGVLGTILYSSERKLAIVDGRIVGVGDQIRGARITEITPSSVLLRDRKGQLRQLTLGAGLR
jgi:hypothetical protein